MPAELLDQPQKTRPGEELDAAKLEVLPAAGAARPGRSD